MSDNHNPEAFSKEKPSKELQSISRRGFVTSTGALAFSSVTLSACFGPDYTSIAEAGSVWWNAPMLVAREDGFMEAEGLDVTSFDVPTGLESKNAIVSDNADFGVVASTPLVNAAAKGEEKDDILVLGSYMTSTALIGVVHPTEVTADAMLRNPAIGEIAYTKGTISEFYFRKLLQDMSLNGGLEQYDRVNVSPPGTIPAVVGGGSKAAVAFEPFLSLAVSEGARQGVPLKKSVTPNIYELRSYLITSRRFYEDNTEIVNKMKAAYAAACADIVARPDHYKAQMTDRFGFPQGFLDGTWESVNFEFSTGWASIKATLSEELSLAKAAEMPGLVGLEADVFDRMLEKLS